MLFFFCYREYSPLISFLDFCQKNILNFFFLCWSCSSTPFPGMSVVCVYTRIFEVSGHRLSHFPGPAQFSRVLCQNMHLIFILDSFLDSLPQHINIVCRTSICGRSCAKTLEYLLFKGLAPCAVLIKRKRDTALTHSVTNRESFKIPQSTSPLLFVPVQEGWGEITWEQSSACECVYILDVCAIVPVWGFVMLMYVYLCQQT